MKSMTGFGRFTLERDGRELTVELKSVNHRFLDIGMRLPRSLLFLEDAIRKTLQQKMQRGHVDVYINLTYTQDTPHAVQLDEGLLAAYAQTFARAAQLTALPNDACVSKLLSLPDVLSVTRAQEDADAISALCRETTAAAADALGAMRENEGTKLQADLSVRINALKSLLAAIEGQAPGVASEYAERLRARMEELLGRTPVDEARLANEVAVFADKASITEEIVRLHSHFDQFLETMDKSEPVGRKLDFIVQEFNREFNTIGSKANNLTITNAVMEAKGEVEKIREQIQNIE